MSNSIPSTFTGLLPERAAPFRALAEALSNSPKPITLGHLPGSALAFVLAGLSRVTKRPILVLTASGERAEDIAGDVEFFGASSHHYPKWEVLPYDEEDLGLEITAKTLDVFEALTRWHTDKLPFVVSAAVDSLLLRTLPKERMNDLTVRVKWGDRLDTNAFADALQQAGYERQPLVEARGEFSIRGGIVDVYPLNSENPFRIDLFGDEIESIRLFDVSTQRSLQDLGTGADLLIPPASLKRQLTVFLKQEGKLRSFFDFLPPECLVVYESPEKFPEVCTHFRQAVERQYERVRAADPAALPPSALLLDQLQLEGALKTFRRIDHSAAEGMQQDTKGTVHIEFATPNHVAYDPNLDSWLTQIKKFQSSDYVVAVVCDNDGQIQRFDDLLSERGIIARPLTSGKGTFELQSILSGSPEVLLLVGEAQGGFALGDARFCLMTDREIFGRYKRRHLYRKIYKGKPIQTSGEIRRNDYVVHVDHGIGKFLGMRVQEIDGRAVELIELLYADDDKLLVPVEKIHKVQKYAGPESAVPSLDKLGSNKWAKRRKKHSEEIEKLADELLQLYASRQLAQREPHTPDSRQQLEFESSFLYRETPDQMKAIVDSKTDMERQRPMDRLVCGDVGYGKTEVAIRTIFKAVQSGRQACLLCPTTILAQQHFHNLRERFADYPVRLEMISRFRSPAEIKAVKKKLKEGELDVVVGTHALLAKDVEFRNLGLVVVDEEQRFGVRAKERLKEMRTEVDILTLSATPIPRTLHMALSGLRDLSIITTPPPDRQPIKTKVIAFETEQIAEAILRELNRGGQVYFIHNRVASIEEVVQRLKEIVPHAKIKYAHGQMDEEELENTMIAFIDRQFDILVATTIIESGVDIPNCNTIIINRADAFGLAQLYQLRGRVGREKRRAYAYLIVPQGKAITESAVKRLQAIEEFAELGAGFSIAMRDLEIRGAGDLLGKAQHGSITEIGFELFCELLEEKVQEKTGQKSISHFDVEVKWDVSCYLPPPYVPIESQRVTFYKRFAGAREPQDLDAIAAELRDRYGELPEAAAALLESYRIRLACVPLRIAGLKRAGNRLRFTFIEPIAAKTLPTFARAQKATDGVLAVAQDTFDQTVATIQGDLSPLAAFAIARAFLDRLAEESKGAPAP